MKPNMQNTFFRNVKKTLMILLPLALIITGSAFTVKNPAPENANLKIKVVIDIGKKSRDCRGLGICDITVEIELFRMANNQVSATATSEDGNLNLAIDEKSLSTETNDAYFRTGFFVVEEDFTLSDEVIKTLDLPEGYTIRAGKYSVEKNGGFLQLSFDGSK